MNQETTHGEVDSGVGRHRVGSAAGAGGADAVRAASVAGPVDRWVMPPWMEPYRDLFRNTGGNTIEDLLHELSNPRLAAVNLPVFALAVAVQSQVGLLTALHNADMLRAPARKPRHSSAQIVKLLRVLLGVPEKYRTTAWLAQHAGMPPQTVGPLLSQLAAEGMLQRRSWTPEDGGDPPKGPAIKRLYTRIHPEKLTDAEALVSVAGGIR